MSSYEPDLKDPVEENARNMGIDELSRSFIPTTVFWKLLERKNHVLVGSRGSGKTACAKMISHGYMSKLASLGNEQAAGIIRSRDLVGVYVSTKTEWVSSLASKPWLSKSEKEDFFRFRINLACCQALLQTVRSCIDEYVTDSTDRLYAERDISRELSEFWLERPPEELTLAQVGRTLEDIEYLGHERMAERRVYQGKEKSSISTRFHDEFLKPFRIGIRAVQERIRLNERVIWMLSVDEAEFLDDDHMRILNSQLRSDSGNIRFKITTLPYRHTLKTNLEQDLNIGHDFEYLYLSNDPLTRNGLNFAQRLAEQTVSRLVRSEVELDDYFGRSRLFSGRRSSWTDDSQEFGLLRRYSSEDVVRRAERLRAESPKDFRDQIGRKLHPLLLLRSAVDSEVGARKTEIYSGTEILLRSSDGNPRRLIRLLKDLCSEIAGSEDGKPIIPPAIQSEILIRYSGRELVSSQSEPLVGPQLYLLLMRVGELFNVALHKRKLMTDVPCSFSVGSDIPDSLWRLVMVGVQASLIVPCTNQNAPEEAPYRSGVFQLANVLAPRFRLFPRRGPSLRLTHILSSSAGIEVKPSFWDAPSN